MSKKFKELLRACTAEIHKRLVNYIRGVRTHTPAVRKPDDDCVVMRYKNTALLSSC